MGSDTSVLSWISPYMFFALLFVGFVLLASAIARDARRRGKSPVLVMLLMLISFPLGLIVWLLFRPEPIEPDNEPFDLRDHRVQ